MTAKAKHPPIGDPAIRPPAAPLFTTDYVAAIYGSEFLRRDGGGDMFYTGPFYGDRIPQGVRAARRVMVQHYLPHTFTDYADPKDPRRGTCRICGFPAADAACKWTVPA